MYTATILSRLLYGTQTWSAHNRTHLRPIECKLQNTYVHALNISYAQRQHHKRRVVRVLPASTPPRAAIALTNNYMYTNTHIDLWKYVIM